MAARVKKTKKERIYADQYNNDPEHLTRPAMKLKFWQEPEDEEPDLSPDSPMKGSPEKAPYIQNEDLMQPDDEANVVGNIDPKDFNVESPRLFSEGDLKTPTQVQRGLRIQTRIDDIKIEGDDGLKN